jgi:hypothetical protein
LLWLVFSISSALVGLAEDVEAHGPGWWIARILLGLLAFGFVFWLWTLLTNVVAGIVNGTAYFLGLGLAKLLQIRGRHGTLYAIGINGVELGRTLAGFLLGLTAFWYAVLVPLWVAVPRWTLMLGVLVWILVWMPSVALTAFAQSRDDTQ